MNEATKGVKDDVACGIVLLSREQANELGKRLIALVETGSLKIGDDLQGLKDKLQELETRVQELERINDVRDEVERYIQETR